LRRWRGPALALAVAALAGCGRLERREPLPESAIPLATLASSVRAWTETDELDIGAPSARSALWSGWGPDETTGEMTFVWGLAPSSKLHLTVVEPRTRTLRMRGWAYPFGDDPPLEVELRVNGRTAGRRLLSARPGTLQIELEQALWRVGENELELVYSRADQRPGEPPRAAGWDGLRFDDRVVESASPPALAANGTVVLPHRTALEWTLELPPGSFLAWDAVVRDGGARPMLSLREEGGERGLEGLSNRRQARLTPAAGPHRLVSLTLAALGGGGTVRLEGARLHLPSLAALPGGAPAPPASAPTAAAAPNVLVYLVDTLRADRLGCYGYARPTSPSIDRFARTAVLWREGRAQSSWTRPAVASIFTGLQPPTHRAQESFDRLPEEAVTLAERFATAGWQTAFISTNGNVSARVGFNQGWDEFRYLAERRRNREHHVQSAEVNDHVFDWLDRRDPSRPFLLVVHTSDPHDPYTPPERFRKLLAAEVTDAEVGSRSHISELLSRPADEALRSRSALSALYDAEIAANDESFGRLLAALDVRGIGERTAVLLLSDHGEEFFEHGGWTHGRNLYEEQLRIPFVLRLPGRVGAGQVHPGPAEQIDVVPTLLAVAGLAPDPELPGRNLLEDLRGAGPRRGETQSLAWLKRNNLVQSSIARSQWKLIDNENLGGDWSRPPLELYGLGNDAGESDNRALTAPLRRAWLEGLLAAARARFATGLAGEPVELDAELEANLRALGYL
jgi:arylsulfatase A-like enzyme